MNNTAAFINLSSWGSTFTNTLVNIWSGSKKLS